jgi:hypothetical protein
MMMMTKDSCIHLICVRPAYPFVVQQRPEDDEDAQHGCEADVGIAGLVIAFATHY